MPTNRCEVCDNKFDTTDMQYSKKSGQYLCTECSETHDFCQDCGTIYHKDEMTVDDDGDYTCDECDTSPTEEECDYCDRPAVFLTPNGENLCEDHLEDWQDGFNVDD